MTQYGLIQAIFMSFYSKNLYRDVALNWGGKALLYLLFLLSLSWIVFTVQLQQGLKEGYLFFSEKIVHQIPVLSIKEGAISTPENRPYKIINPDNKETIAIIDTSGEYTTLDQAQTPLLITETEVLSRPKADETRVNKLPSNLTMVVDPQVINTFFSKYLGFAWLLVFPALVIFSFIYRLFQIILYSILGKIFSAIFGAGLAFGQVMQIMLVAITPTIVIATLFEFFNIYFDYQLTFYFFLAIIYLLYGIIANINTTRTPPQ